MLKSLKRCLKLILRRFADFKSGQDKQFCRIRHQNQAFDFSLNIQQAIKPSETFASKVHNLKAAAAIVNQYTIESGEIFSFWQTIGNPKNHFQSSRSIIKGKTVNEIGGGICQISGLIYFVAIKAKLDILERHNHSLDLYTDETRFAPLGSDATVVYGYKDLRIRNPFDFPIQFFIQTHENDTQIHIQLRSTQKIDEHEIVFEKQEYGDYCEVRVSYENGEMINVSRYAYPTRD